MRILDVRGIRRNGHVVEEHDGAFLRDVVFDRERLLGFRRTVAGLQRVARPAERQADLAVGQIFDVLRGIDEADVRTDREKHLFGGLQVVRILGVGVLAEIDEHGADDF